jgi:hypothetical protein
VASYARSARLHDLLSGVTSRGVLCRLLPLLLLAAFATAGLAATPAPAKRHRCDPSYKGRCLRPNVSDYDCAGGGGNGPYYVRGPFRVVGTDHYRLDADHDGTACES